MNKINCDQTVILWKGKWIIMKKILMSGDCRIGEIGKITELFDSYGEQLFTGDLVALSTYDDNNPELYQDYWGIEFVCNNEFQDDGLEKSIYVMGVYSEHKQYVDGDGNGESIVYQNHKKWRIRKVKGYEDLVNGEIWGVVRVAFVEDDFCL